MTINWTEVQQYYDNNHTIKDCILKFGGGFPAYSKAVKLNLLKLDRTRLSRKNTRPDKFNWNEVQNYYDLGFSINETVKNFKMSVASIFNAVKRNSMVLRNPSDAIKLSYKMGRRKIPARNEKFLEELSLSQSSKNRGGKSKWFEIAGKKLQGTWERNMALKFEELNINWIKPTVNKDIWRYEIDGKIKSYTPDFYLPDYDLFLEIKGYWWGNDKEKMKNVIEQHMDKKLIIIEKDDYEKILGSEQAWLLRWFEEPHSSVRS